MMQTRLAIIAFCLISTVAAQDKTYHLDPVARVEFPNVVWSPGDTAGGSDCWGYLDKEGNDYAIMGYLDGTAIVRVNDLEVVETIPGPEHGDSYYHRDMMTYGDYLYVCSEMTGTNQGINIIDLSPLPDSVRIVGTYDENDLNGYSGTTSHNLFVDEATATLYVLRSYGNGFRVLSLQDPEKPVDVSIAVTPDIHDIFSRNDTVFVAEGYNRTFSIWDATDKMKGPKLLKRVSVPAAGYVHTVWTTEDGSFLMTAEETSNKTVKMWDIRDYDNIELVGEYLGANKLAHNVHIKGDLAFISHYSSGAVVVDISDPAQLNEVASYDTYTASDRSTYLGAWGIYPYSPNGYVYVSNVEGYLDILRFREETISLSDEHTLPSRIMLRQNTPNPFNAETTLELTLHRNERIRLEVFNSLGARVATLAEGHFPAGEYRFLWHAGDLPSGLYFARLTSAGENATAKMLLLK